MDYENGSRSWYQYIFILYFIFTLSLGAFFNIYINYLGKGETWDLYPYAEILWVIISVVITFKVKNFKHLILAIIIFLFLDGWVDLVAMGHHSWWAGPPILIEWKWWGLLRQYWFFKWVLQVPARCLALAVCVIRPFEDNENGRRKLLAIILIYIGLNVIWASAGQDMLFYFVWRGLYDPSFPYFHYMPPAGTWNLYNMLFLRIPIMYSIGFLLIYFSKRINDNLYNSEKHINKYQNKGNSISGA